MKKLMSIFLLYILWISCQDVQVGYLITEYASYGVDSMVIRKELDTTEPYWGPNPEYQQYLDWGYTPEQIAMFFPTVKPQALLGAGEDYYRVLNHQPWTGSAIEGVEGSTPIWIRIKSATSSDGDAPKLMECATVRGNGMIEIPLDNDIPKGHYLLSLTFWNEGWSKDLDNCFTVIVR